MMALDAADLRRMTGGAIGVTDAACPECGPDRRSAVNRIRKVLRIWDDGRFVSYSCARCMASGWAIDRTGAATPPKLPQAEKRHPDLARMLWDRAMPMKGTLAEIYLRARSCLVEADSLRFLPARGQHGPAMIARFGAGPVTGVHLTRLSADGRTKAGTDADKIMIGQSLGQPIVIRDNPDCGDLLVAEGIEDAATLANVTGWTAWAAGSAWRIPPVMAQTGLFERVFIAVDNDKAARRAFGSARGARADLIPLRLDRVFGRNARIDANAAARQYGPAALLAAIEWTDAAERFRRGEIGTERMLALRARADRVFAEFTP